MSFKMVSQSKIMERSSVILSDCSNVCLDLQDVLSKLIDTNSSFSCEFATELQALDKLSQQLSDLSCVFMACSTGSDNGPAAFLNTIQNSTNLVETRSRLFGDSEASSKPGELDLL